MKYTVEPWMFEKNPNACFGVVVGAGLKNAESSEEDAALLVAAQDSLIARYTVEDLKNHEDFLVYRDALQNVGINPNKFTHSVEAMTKRILKGSRLPAINALVDLCNAISVQETISLGGHDLRDIHEDLWVGRAGPGARYRPFGEEAFEPIPEGEVVFTSGNVVQTRQWLWRQSELGKMTLETTDVFFQLVGFDGPHYAKLDRALDRLEGFVTDRFHGTSRRFVVTRDQKSIEF
jgi:DNA/RNA-binding domain of Phe-tRNA-synthetase-like protein